MKKTLHSKIKSRIWQILFVTFAVITLSFSYPSVLQQNVTIKLKNATIEELLLELNRLNQFEIVYSISDLTSNKRITATYANTPVTKILDECLKGTLLRYRIENNSIIIFKPTQVASRIKNKVSLRGIIQDNKKKPIVGATIIIPGTTNGAISDVNGRFIMVDTLGVEVEVSYIGFKSKKVKLTLNEMSITLEVDVVAVNDVIVTGYNTIRKESFTGNATTVTKKDLLKINNKNVISALQFFDPSFRLKENSMWGSDPNSLPEFNIRGESSIAMKKGLGVEMDKRTQRVGLQDNPNLPIFILDGFEATVQKIYDMDINRIESITILKDAAATAQYGSRAANGVVVVVTIPPKPGELRVTYNFTAGAELPDLSDYNLCNAREKLMVEKGAGVYTAENPELQVHKDQEYNEVLNQVKRGIDTDWLAIPLRNVFNHTHSLSIQGGVETIKYGIDLNYDSNNGAMKGSHRSRMGVGLTLDYSHRKWLQIMNNISFNNTSGKDSPYGDFSQYGKLQPYSAIYGDDGEMLAKLNESIVNPLWGVRNLESYSGKNNINDITNNLSINIYFFEGFSFRGRLGITKSDSDSETFKDPKDPIYSATSNNQKGHLSKMQNNNFNWDVNAMFYYNKEIKKHFINATAGINVRETNSKKNESSFRGFSLGTLSKPSYAAEQIDKSNYTSSESRLFGILTSLNYSFDNIYLLDASFRLDGSSQFGSDKRFAPFWSVGAGINIHNYEWMRNLSVIDKFRIRATYGSTGKTNFASYAAVTTYAINSESWYYTGPASSLFYLGNPLLTWETTNTFDIGFSAGLFSNILNIDASYYHKQTKNLINEISIRGSSGFDKYYSNTGSILNEGFEVLVSATAFRNENWMVTFTGNINANKNKITELGREMEEYNKKLQDNYNAETPEYPELAKIPLIQYYIGASTSAIYAVPSYGIDPANGKEKFRKKNGSSTYIWTAEDQIVVGDNNPKAQGSFGINLAFKGVYLNTSFLYQWGGQAYNETLLNKVENASIATENVDKRVLTERWKKPGDLSPYYDLKNNTKTNPSTRFVQDYNLLSLNSISCGYDFPSELIKKFKLTSLGISFNANDVVRWSSVKQERGIGYPYAKTYSFTVNIGF